MKITYSKDNINAFGGINFADHIINNAGIYSTIGKQLSARGLYTTYSYVDLIRSYLLLVLCGGECAEDINTHLRKELEQVKGFSVCSADTLLRMQKELSTPKETSISKTHIEHDYNINMSLNRLLVKLLIQTKQLVPDSNKGYIFEYDNQFIPTDKYDSKRSYKKADGYFPGIASVSNFPVYIENRNGNSHVKYRQDEILDRASQIMKKFGM